MRLDHIAYRVKNRNKTAQFFIDCFGYKLATGKGLKDGGFKLKFEDNSTAECLVLVPPECNPTKDQLWKIINYKTPPEIIGDKLYYDELHLPPEIFISDGSEDSIVGRWVKARDGVGGIHHLAYQVENPGDVEKTMSEWKEKGYAEFCSAEPLNCPGLTQIFTKPSELTGVIYELIHRTEQGFCQANVKDLMGSTEGL